MDQRRPNGYSGHLEARLRQIEARPADEVDGLPIQLELDAERARNRVGRYIVVSRADAPRGENVGIRLAIGVDIAHDLLELVTHDLCLA